MDARKVYEINESLADLLTGENAQVAICGVMLFLENSLDSIDNEEFKKMAGEFIIKLGLKYV